MADCIFCQIISGQLPCAKIYEDDRIISFLDINPVNVGHTLVLPKQHYPTLLDIPDAELQACATVCRKIAGPLLKSTGAAGLNFFQNNFRCAGQIIDHIHFHLIPRYPHDGFMTTWPGKSCLPGELEKVAKRIKAEVDAA